MLSLPLSLSLAGNTTTALCMMAFSCIMNACTFVMLGACCRWTGKNTFRGVFDALFGRRFSFIVDLTIFANSFIACVSLMILIGDFASQSLGVDKNLSIVGIGLVIVVPLCFLNSLSPLALSSAFGLLVTLYTFAFVVFQSTKSPDKSSTSAVHLSILKSWSLFNTCFLAHYNAPRYHAEMNTPTARRFAVFVATAFSVCLVVYVTFAIAGFRIFGNKVKGDVLESFDGNDLSLRLCRVGMVFSVSCTYPLIFASLKEACARAISERFRKVFILVVVTMTIILAIRFDDVSKFSALKGATSSCILSYILPTVMYIRAQRISQTLLTRDCEFPRIFVIAVLIIGATLGFVSFIYLCFVSSQ